MRKTLLIVGLLLVVAGGVIASGRISVTRDTDLVKLGPVELTAQKKEPLPVNLGWVLLGIGGISLVAGAVTRK